MDDTNVHEIFEKGGPVDKEHLIRLWVHVHEICRTGRPSDKEHSVAFWDQFSPFLPLRDRACFRH